MIDTILKYFTLTDKQKQQFEQIGNLYPEWNAKINVISRKDIDNLWGNHILHSLAIAKFINPSRALHSSTWAPWRISGIPSRHNVARMQASPD